MADARRVGQASLRAPAHHCQLNALRCISAFDLRLTNGVIAVADQPVSNDEIERLLAEAGAGLPPLDASASSSPPEVQPAAPETRLRSRPKLPPRRRLNRQPLPP